MFPVDVVKLIHDVSQIQSDFEQKQNLLNKLNFENDSLLKQLETINNSIQSLNHQLNVNAKLLKRLEENDVPSAN